MYSKALFKLLNLANMKYILRANLFGQTAVPDYELSCYQLLQIMSYHVINYLSARAPAYSMYILVSPVQSKYVTLSNTSSPPSKPPNYLEYSQHLQIVELVHVTRIIPHEMPTCNVPYPKLALIIGHFTHNPISEFSVSNII